MRILSTKNSDDKISLKEDVQLLSEEQKNAPLSEIYKEEHLILETDMERNPRDFQIKRKIHTSQNQNNRYFRNNAHIYQNESDIKSKGIKTVKQHSNYMQAIQKNAKKQGGSGIKIERWHRVTPHMTSSIKNDSDIRIRRINNVYLEKFSTNFNTKEMRLKISDADNDQLMSTRRHKK